LRWRRKKYGLSARETRHSSYIEKIKKPGDIYWHIHLPDKPIVFAPPIILGDESRAGWVIGAAAPPTDPLPAFPSQERTTHHHMSLTLHSARGRPDVVVMTIRLFHHIGTPTYYVIVGEALLSALVELKDQDNAQVP
jgi:hypothetical protein